MYTCQMCGKTVPRGTAANRVVIETRPKRYPHRPEANREILIKGKKVKPDDPGGVGFEIVREVIVCSDCAQRVQQDEH